VVLLPVDKQKYLSPLLKVGKDIFHVKQ